MRLSIVRNILLIVLSMVCLGPLKAQPFYTHSTHPRVKTLQVIAEDDFERLPILGFEGTTTLAVSFDYLSDEQPLIDYTVIHCNAAWERDNLDELDYLESSFLPQHVETVTPSFNTFVQYAHYEVAFPNDQVKPTVSGNYAVLFHLQDEPDSLLAVATFMVSEEQMIVSGSVSGNTDIDFNAMHQQLTLQIGWTKDVSPYLNPDTELKVLVQQNRRRDNQRWLDHPSRIESTQVYYEHQRQLIFEAGNHWRRFEFTNHRYPGLGVDYIRYHAPVYYAYLNRDEARPIANYRYDQDQNGRYLVHSLNVDDVDTEADYFMAMFSLDAPASVPGGGIYLVGDFTYQETDASTRMEYDLESGMYYKEVLLKAGAYNYQYLVPVRGGLTTSAIEGNHYETPNEYQIFIYYHPFASRYDRLLGVAVVR